MAASSFLDVTENTPISDGTWTVYFNITKKKAIVTIVMQILTKIQYYTHGQIMNDEQEKNRFTLSQLHK